MITYIFIGAMVLSFCTLTVFEGTSSKKNEDHGALFEDNE